MVFTSPKFQCVIFSNIKKGTATSSDNTNTILDCSVLQTLTPSAELASELWWPTQTWMLCLFEDASVQPQCNISCQAAGLSTPGFFRNIVVQRAANCKQDPSDPWIFL